MFYFKQLIFLLYCGIFIFLNGCVGTVKTLDPVSTVAKTTKDSALQDYVGINSVKTVADTKVEIFFTAITGDTDQISYVINYAGQQISTYVPASSLRPDYRGYLKYTVTGLQPDTQYDFTVQARNITTGAESTNSATKRTRTFGNATANFTGITQVRNLSGADGLNGIEVFWNEAETLGSVISKNEIDPIEYQVTVINADSLNPGNMNDINFTTPVRKVFSIAPTKRSSIINGLNQGTKYYVQVRAIHYGYSLYSADANYKLEQNSNYLEISTYTDSLASMNFLGSSFVTSFPPGVNGLYSINTQWTSPVGNFDHYRIYYAVHGTTDLTNFLNTAIVNPFCFGPETNDSNIQCEFVDYNKNTFSLTGLNPNTKYDLMMAVCLTSDCLKTKRAVSNLRNHTTTPAIASFTGITSIDTARSLSSLDKLFLNYNLPDFTSGNISGLIVEYYGSDSTNPNPIPLNDSSFVNTSGLTVDTFDYMTSVQISISGVDPLSAVPYCFLVYPFTYNNDGSKNYSKTGLIPKCQTPAIVGPKAVSFTGVTNATCNISTKDAVIDWTPPNINTGIYNQFEFYFIKDSSTFNFGTATDPLDTTYTKVILNNNQTSVHLTNLTPGASYKFGVLTLYQSINGPVRSEFNANIGTCSF